VTVGTNPEINYCRKGKVKIMATNFAPVELATLEQGEFFKKCEAAFKELQTELISHVEKHDLSATAATSIKVSVKYDREKKAYAIIAEVENKMPKKPSSVTSAFVGEDPKYDGRECLFASASGTNLSKDPRQSVFCTDKGEMND
jgi:hypothetical protein